MRKTRQCPPGLKWARRIPPPRLVQRGRWFYCCWYEKVADGDDGGVLIRDHRRSLDTIDPAEAAKCFARWQLDIADGKPLLGDESLLSSVVKSYLEYQGHSWDPKTKLRNTQALGSVLRLVGDVPVTASNFRTQMECYRDQRLAEKVTPRTVNIEVQVLGAALKHVSRRIHGFTSPLAGVRPLKDPATTAAALAGTRRLTGEEIAKIGAYVDELDNQGLHQRWLRSAWLAARFMLFTGLRRNELVNLRRKDISDGHIKLRVRNDWKPKCAHERDVPLMPEATEVLEEILPNARGDYLFLTPKGSPWLSDTLYHRIRELYRDAKVEEPKELNVHTLRHTFNSRLAEEGVSREARAKIMGHASLSLQDRYTHLEPKVVSEAVVGLRLYQGVARVRKQA